MKHQTLLITGAAGFIGSSFTHHILPLTKHVIGIDNLYENYSVKFKKESLLNLGKYKNFTFIKADIRDRERLDSIFKKYLPTTVIHLAALTGVRKSLSEPKLFNDINAAGTLTIFETAARNSVESFIFSSSSSVYGNGKVPFKENQRLAPLSPYAKSKVNAEEILKKLSKKHKVPTTILRFFSVYGPFGRPDMAPYLFTEAAYNNKRIDFFGSGNTARDYTYIEDVVKAITCAIEKNSLWQIFNVGSARPVSLTELTDLIEKFTKFKLRKKARALLSAESRETYADISKIKKYLYWTPGISFEEGIKKFIDWYKKNRL